MSQVKVFVTDWPMDEWVLMYPALAKGGGQQPLTDLAMLLADAPVVPI